MKTTTGTGRVPHSFHQDLEGVRRHRWIIEPDHGKETAAIRSGRLQASRIAIIRRSMHPARRLGLGLCRDASADHRLAVMNATSSGSGFSCQHSSACGIAAVVIACG
jgi:hypothetical protein